MFTSEKPWLKVYEGYTEPEAEFFEGSLYELFRESVEEHKEKVALSFYGTEIGFPQLQAMADKMAAALAAIGVEKGDRVALMLPNCPQYVVGFFATVRLGAIVTQLNPMYVEREIEHILTDSGAETIVVYADMYERVKNVLPASSLKNVVVVSFGGTPEGLEEDHYTFDSFLGMDAEDAPEVEIDPGEDVAALQYTGGTTGVSKGAMLTHRNLAANVRQAIEVFVENEDDFSNNEGSVAVLPYFHIYGLTSVMMFSIKTGCKQLLLPRFEVEEVLKLVQENEPALFAGVPTMYMGLHASGVDLKEYGFDKIRVFNSGGAAMPVNLLHALEEKTGRRIYEGYGLSEASPVTHFNPIFAERRPGSIGVPIPSTNAKVVDVEDGASALPVGESGELAISGPQVMKGYWNMPEETADTLRDGWLYTGDVATMDEDGYFYIVDRKKDMIVAGGYNVYPREIEEVLFEHPDVSEAVAVGVPDEYRGESVKAFVVKKEDSDVTEEEILDFCKERLAPYKTPKSLEFRDELPKSTVGKLLRRVLADEEKEKAANGSTDEATEPPSPS
ncbi:MAG: long-chain fatty acid--CoA ligase [Rubrobacteraceae bacterium]